MINYHWAKYTLTLNFFNCVVGKVVTFICVINPVPAVVDTGLVNFPLELPDEPLTRVIAEEVANTTEPAVITCICKLGVVPENVPESQYTL